jgi:hypothetical protein
LDYLDAEVNINSVWETIRENINISVKEIQGMLKIIKEKKKKQFQWLHDPSERNGVNLNNIRLEASRDFKKV